MFSFSRFYLICFRITTNESPWLLCEADLEDFGLRLLLEELDDEDDEEEDLFLLFFLSSFLFLPGMEEPSASCSRELLSIVHLKMLPIHTMVKRFKFQTCKNSALLSLCVADGSVRLVSVRNVSMTYGS